MSAPWEKYQTPVSDKKSEPWAKYANPQGQTDRSAPSPTEKKSLLSRLATKAAGILSPIDNGGTTTQNLQEAFVPQGGIVEQLKRLANPLAGRFGLSRFLQQEGQKVSGAEEAAQANLPEGSALGKVATATKFVGDMAGMGQLTPEAAQTAIATNAAGEAIGSGVAKMGSKIFKVFGSKVGSAFSGLKPASYGRLLDDPAAILPEALGGPKSMAKAGAAIGESLDAAGVVKNISPTASHGAIVDSMFSKIADAVPASELTEKNIPGLVSVLTPTEQADMLKSLRMVMKTAVEGKDQQILRNRMLWKNALVDALESGAPGYAQNVKDYARAALREEFSSILPRNKYGTPSIGRVFFGGGPVGAAAGAAGGPLAGVLAGGASVSPLVHGAATAATGAALKSAPYVTPVGLRAILDKAKKKQGKK